MPVDAHEQRCLPLSVSFFDNVMDTGHCRRIGARTHEPLVKTHDLLDVASELDARGREDDQVIADPLQVGDDVRGEQHGQPILGGRAHQDA